MMGDILIAAAIIAGACIVAGVQFYSIGCNARDYAMMAERYEKASRAYFEAASK